jgi:hypothetical protein
MGTFTVEAVASTGSGLLTFAMSACGFMALQHYFTRICVPKLVYQKSEANEALVVECQALKSFRASPFLLPDYHGHMHSIVPAAVRGFFKTRLKYDRELLTVGDGGTVGLDWVREGPVTQPSSDGAVTRPVVVLVHGLCGSTESSYIIYAARAFARQGYEVVSFVSRGCGKLALTTPLSFTASNFDDLGSAIEHIHQERPGRGCKDVSCGRLCDVTAICHFAVGPHLLFVLCACCLYDFTACPGPVTSVLCRLFTGRWYSA